MWTTGKVLAAIFTWHLSSRMRRVLKLNINLENELVYVCATLESEFRNYAIAISSDLWQIMVHVIFMQNFATSPDSHQFWKVKRKRSGLAGMDSISLTNLLGLKPENCSANIHLLITSTDFIFCHEVRPNMPNLLRGIQFVCYFYKFGAF